MLTRFLHDRYPVEGAGDGLATASRHAAFSTFAYARFSETGKLVPIPVSAVHAFLFFEEGNLHG